MVGRTTQFIACSKAVANNLITRVGVDNARVNVIPEFIPNAAIDPERLEKAAAAVRAELGIPPGAIVVGGAGSVTWRKGYDLFILAALSALRAEDRNELHFVWLGGTTEHSIPRQITHDLRTSGFQQRIHFVDHRTNYLDYMASFDMLCLTSREDPFPLVVLECAALQKPVICFDASGGIPEFVSNDSGFVVPYLDIPAMASRVMQLANDASLRNALGACGAAKTRERHDVSVVAPRIAELIERVSASGA
jgi:glycosyltransferase involved in cell wall biosynthesis